MKLKKDKKGREIIPDSFERISIEELLPGDILLFYGGNKLTEWHGRNRRKKFGRTTLPPYHATVVYGKYREQVIILDPEITTSLSLLMEYLTKTKIRMDVVRFEATAAQRCAIQSKIEQVVSEEGFYDWRGYFSFISQLPLLDWVKIIKPSKKTFYCSDAATFVVQESTNIKVSPRGHNYTAPVDLQRYGMYHHKLYTLKMGRGASKI